MIIKTLYKTSDIKEFIQNNYTNEKLVVKRETEITVQDIRRVLKICNDISEFLTVEIGSNYFLIKKQSSILQINQSICCISDRSFAQMIQEEI